MWSRADLISPCLEESTAYSGERSVFLKQSSQLLLENSSLFPWFLCSRSPLPRFACSPVHSPPFLSCLNLAGRGSRARRPKPRRALAGRHRALARGASPAFAGRHRCTRLRRCPRVRSLRWPCAHSLCGWERSTERRMRGEIWGLLLVASVGEMKL